MKTNAYALVAHQLASAALGFVYWLLAARLYPVEAVGLSSAVISAVLLISGISQLGLVGGLGRFLPRAGGHSRRLVASAYAVAGVSSALAAALVLLLGGVLGLAIVDLPGGIHAAWLLFATVAWTLFFLQDGALIGLREAPWVLIENFVYNAAKIVVLVVLAQSVAGTGIIVSWFAPAPVLVILVTWLLFARLLRPDRLGRLPAREERFTIREFATSVSGEHLGAMVGESTIRLLPLIVVSVMGTTANAYFYQAWMIATTLGLVANGMATSFTAETAADRRRAGPNSRAILQNMATILLPAIVLVGVAAPLILSIFGGDYARESTSVLRWLALGALPAAFNSWYLAYCRVMGRIKKLIALQVLVSVTLLVLSYVGMAWFGIAGVGIAWVIAQSVTAAAAATDARRVLGTQEPPCGTTIPGAESPEQSERDEQAGPLGPASPVGSAADPVRPDEPVFVSPHLDDAVLSCGGILRRFGGAGGSLTVTVFTADMPLGDALPPAAQRAHAVWGTGDAPFAVRAHEDRAAMGMLGSSALHLGLPDAIYRRLGEGRRSSKSSSLDSPAGGKERDLVPTIVELLRPVLAAKPKSLVFCPLGVGGHIDHVLVRRAVEALCDPDRIVYYEEYPYAVWRHSAVARTREGGTPLSEFVVQLTPEEVASKIAAVACYESQLHGLFPTAGQRLRMIAYQRIPALGPRILGCPDPSAARALMARQIERDIAAARGERYVRAEGFPSPLPAPGMEAGDER